jgi:hypothetical protein
MKFLLCVALIILAFVVNASLGWFALGGYLGGFVWGPMTALKVMRKHGLLGKARS